MESTVARKCPPTVLIVDDDARVRSFLRAALEEEVEVWVVEAESGEKAIEILEAPRRTLDLMLVDYVLPGRSGLQILQLTRRRWPWIPVIMLTAFGSEDLAIKAFRAGARDYLRKPVALDTLTESVRALTAARREKPGDGSAATSAEMNDKTPSVHPNVRRALAFMLEHFTEEITLDDVAHAASVSRFHFCRLFHRETGVTFHEYLHELRVGRAKTLLVDRHLTVSEAAYTVGFNDLSHFDRTFRKIVGSSPTEYRRSLRSA
jgi:YesN/AraC family two-component response regulator